MVLPLNVGDMQTHLNGGRGHPNYVLIHVHLVGSLKLSHPFVEGDTEVVDYDE